MTAEEIRRDFPIFAPGNQPLVYLDNAATSQKPETVIDRMSEYYRHENANIHRGNYPLSARSQREYDLAREAVRGWIDAGRAEEIVFTKGSTEAVNLLAYALGQGYTDPKVNIVVTELEHSSNYFPWKELCRRKGWELRVAVAAADGRLCVEAVRSVMDRHTKLLAVTGMSNATGFEPDLEEMISCAHALGALVMVDGTQQVVHRRVSVREMGCDFYCFSGHKLYGPMGIGVLYGKEALLKDLACFLYGGGMVLRGDGDVWEYRKDPEKYEAGTQNIAGAAGLKAALDYLEQIHFEQALSMEEELCGYLHNTLSAIPGIRILGQGGGKQSPIALFRMEGIGSYDIGVLLGLQGICIRCGSHCAYPLMKRLGIQDACRASVGIYNTCADIDRLAQALRRLPRPG